jgi:gliding motility-associated-like protein
LIALNRNIIIFILMLVGSKSFATHYRAGEITYEVVNGRLYRITVTTYTDPNSPANDFVGSIIVYWGDSKNEVVNRTSTTKFGSNVQRNTYIATHQYSSDGNFLVSITEQNRVNNIVNINGGFTEGIPFYVESLIRVNNALGNNSSPILTVPPILDGCLQYVYFHNPGAYDPDGDSLVYSIDVPKLGENEVVFNYSTPSSTDSFSINSQTGNLYWVKPIVPGLYNIAIRITEYRNGIIVGYVVRDMQIKIRECNNDPPLITQVTERCINAGDSIQFNVLATDVNGQRIFLTGFGGPFEAPISPASFEQILGQGQGTAAAKFKWKTDCRHIQYRPHQATIQAVDDYVVPLGSFMTFQLKVVGPAPKNVTIKQIGNGFNISWKKDTCAFANKYKVYRKIDSSFWNPAFCQLGVPANLGFVLIGEVKGNVFANTDTSFYDDNKGEGLSPLINYCYRIVAVFPSRSANGNIIASISSESYASEEVCDEIIRSTPIITQATVNFTSLSNGAIKLAWIRPDTLDTVAYSPPYQVTCKRATVTNGTIGSYVPVKTFFYPTFSSINDTFVIDTNLNTEKQQYSYRLELRYDSAGVTRFIGNSPQAASIFAQIYSTDNTNIITWLERVPWINKEYTIYRLNDDTQIFDSITTTNLKSYSDTGLINGKSYKYIIQSTGNYTFFPTIIYNKSQEIIGIPIDTVKPCAPILTVTPPCTNFNDFTNKLTWIPKPQCASDVLSYNVYYKKFESDNFLRIGNVSAPKLFFNDNRDTLIYSIAGCYAVTGVDSFNNESDFTNTICVDNCPYYEIPNVFSPDNIDGKNDILKPFPYRFIDRVNLKIYNRWGQVVFETTNLDINWDGTTSGLDCSEGTYYYTCDVYEQYLRELKNNKRNGTIKLIR